MTKINTFALVALAILTTATSTAQTKIKDGTISSSALPGTNALLELESNNKGLLLPRIALTGTANAAPLTAHTAGMTVYNTATAGDVTPGYYYNDGTKWVRINQPEPWRVENSSTEASGNTQNIYQMGKVAINKSIATDKQFEVVGDIKAHYDNGAYHSGLNTNMTDFGVPMNLLYVADSANLATASDISLVSLYSGIASIQSTNGLGGGSIAAFSSTTGGSVGLVANNAAQDVSTSIWGYSDGANNNLILSHQKSSAEGANIILEKLNGVSFSFSKTDGSAEGSYTLPRTAGLTNQVLAINTNGGGVNGTSTLAWKDVKNVIGVLPVYSNDAAADADINLPGGALYKLTGSRAVYQKP